MRKRYFSIFAFAYSKTPLKLFYTGLLLFWAGALLSPAGGLQAQQTRNITPEITNAENPLLVERLQELAWQNYEQGRIPEIRVRMAEQEIRNRRWEWFNAITFTYNYTPNFFVEEDNPSRVNRLGLGFVISLGSLAKVPGRIRMAKLDRALASQQVEVQRKDTQNQVVQRYAFYIASAELYQLQLEAVENTTATVNSVRQRFERGDLTVEELQRAEEYLIGARERLIKARTDFFKARYDVEELIGVPLDSVFQEFAEEPLPEEDTPDEEGQNEGDEADAANDPQQN